jgi:rod shape-determining protein MreD
MGPSDRAGSLMAGRFFSPLLPLLCGFLAVVLSNIPVTLMGGGLVPAPLLGLIPIYYWCLVRPDLMTPAATLLVGLLQDVMAGGPPGVWTLAFVVTYAVIDRQRDSFAGLSGLGAVLGFATAALITCVVAYLVIAALYYGRLPPLGPIVGELVITVLFYIPGAYLAGAIHRHLVGPLRSDF